MNPVWRFIKAFGQFWYDFIIGDDWKIAAAVIIALAVTLALPEDTQTEAYDYPESFFAERTWKIRRLVAPEDALLEAARHDATRQPGSPRHRRPGEPASRSPVHPVRLFAGTTGMR